MLVEPCEHSSGEQMSMHDCCWQVGQMHTMQSLLLLIITARALCMMQNAIALPKSATGAGGDRAGPNADDQHNPMLLHMLTCSTSTTSSQSNLLSTPTTLATCLQNQYHPPPSQRCPLPVSSGSRGTSSSGHDSARGSTRCCSLTSLYF